MKATLGRIACRVFITCPLAFWAPESAMAQSLEQLINLDPEQLMAVEVTSVSKRPEPVATAAAAVYVISADDIRRSGATSIPEALRLAPGVDVARLDANKWAISIRGFTSQFANKLLVLMDGRALYSPFFSGVYWDVQDTPLEDIDRIEVIRGPGSTLWGANAVNGVINIITKPSSETRGGMVSLTTGTEDRAIGSFRYGGAISELGHYRVYGKYARRDDSRGVNGGPINDDWDLQRFGFRSDLKPKPGDRLTVSGAMYHGDIGESGTRTSLTAPYVFSFSRDQEVSGGNLLAHWRRALSSGGTLSLQAYYDRTNRSERRLRERRDTVDFDLQNSFSTGAGHEITWGLGYRYSKDRIDGGFETSVDPAGRGLSLYSGFIQGAFSLIPGEVKATLGTKLEHNDFTGFELQPSARLTWTPGTDRTVWAAVSRSVRTPSRVEADGTLQGTTPPFTPTNPGPNPAVLRISSSGDLKAETSISAELGYRHRLSDTLTADIAAFYSWYRDLIQTVAGTPFFEATPLPAHLVIPLSFSNGDKGEVFGGEALVRWRVSDRLLLESSYSLVEIELRNTVTTENRSPHHQLSVRAHYNPRPDWDADAMLRYVDRIGDFGISAYVGLDLRLAWRPRDDLEISIVGQNLLEASHAEFQHVNGDNMAEIERAGYVRLVKKF